MNLVLNRSEPLRFLVRLGEQTVQDISGADVPWKYGTGFLFAFFLEVEKLLNLVMSHEAIAHNAEAIQARVMYKLFDGKDPAFLRAALFRCLIICREINNPRISKLCHIGNPRSANIVHAFVNLRKWFSFNPVILS
jgi:hypothetical protein